MRETFIETCKQLCTVTTVAKYKILKERLEEMAESVPTLYSWIEWWDDRRTHIFGPHRGGGLPGCNLSEQGNAMWKPTNTMYLVHAVCDDVSSMIFQEVKVYLFDRNLMRSTGRTRSKPTRDAQDRAKQITVANDFIEAFSNPAAMLQQIRETLHPSSHLPKGRSSFKPPKANKKDEKKNEKEKQKQKPKSRKHKDVPPTCSSMDQMEKKARLAERIIAGLEDSNSNDKEDNSRKKLRKVTQQNPPIVILTNGLGIKTCQGCGNDITKDQQMYPANMVFRQKGVKAIYNRKYNCIWNKEQNKHYHLFMKCLHEKNQTVEHRDILMNDETFESFQENK